MKKIIVILILLLISLPSFAQMIPQWKNITGESAYTLLWTKNMVQDSQGNSYLIIAAQYMPTNESVYLQPYMIKVNTAGETVWKKDFGFYTDRSEFPYDIKINKNNEIYFYCYQLDTSMVYTGANLIKMNTDGNIIWKKNIETVRIHYSENIKIELDSLENIFVMGNSYVYKVNPAGIKTDSIQFYSENFLPLNDNKILLTNQNKIALYNTNGDSIWSINSICPNLNTILKGDNNCFYISGFRGELLVGNVLGVCKYDLGGNLLWKKELLAPPDIYNKFYSLAPHLAISNDNNLIVGVNTLTAPFSNQQISFVAKYSSQSGDTLWTWRADPAGGILEMIDMIQDRDYNIYITGLSNLSEGNNYSIMKFSSSGELLRKTDNGWYLSDSLKFTPIKMAVRNNGDLTVSGYNNRYSLPSQKVYAITIRYSQPVNISSNINIVPEKFSLLRCYPNPFNPVTTISFQIPQKEFVSLVVYDLNGRVVSYLINEKLNAGEYKINFDGSTLTSGIYFYKLTAGGFSETKKMVLVK